MTHTCDANCPDKSSDTTTKCFSCGSVVYLGCYGVMHRVNKQQFMPESNIQFICNECLSNDGLKRKVAKPSNASSSNTASTIPNGNTTLLKQSTLSAKSNGNPDFASLLSSVSTMGKKIDKIASDMKEVKSGLDKTNKSLPKIDELSSSVKEIIESTMKINVSEIKNIQTTLATINDGTKSSLDKIQQSITAPKATFSDALRRNLNLSAQSMKSIGTTPKVTKKSTAPPTNKGQSTFDFDGQPIIASPTKSPRSTNGNTSSLTTYERMIWLGGLPNSVTVEKLTEYVNKKLFRNTSRTFVFKPLISKDKTLADYDRISYKICVDNEESFNTLIDPAFWPKTSRVREFLDQPKATRLGDFLVTAVSSGNSAIVTKTPQNPMETEQTHRITSPK